MPHRDCIRRAMRERRRALSDTDRREAAEALSQQLASIPEFIDSKKLAAYLPMDGEIDPAPFLQLARQAGKQLYLPSIADGPEKGLRFLSYTPTTSLVKNRYGIPEPESGNADEILANELDMVLVPLVAFDLSGHRIGMGAGYYDRTFAFLPALGKQPKPLLAGIAYEFQCVPCIEAETWDVPLWCIATNRHIYRVQAPTTGKEP